MCNGGQTSGDVSIPTLQSYLCPSLCGSVFSGLEIGTLLRLLCHSPLTIIIVLRQITTASLGRKVSPCKETDLASDPRKAYQALYCILITEWVGPVKVTSCHASTANSSNVDLFIVHHLELLQCPVTCAVTASFYDPDKLWGAWGPVHTARTCGVMCPL